MPVSDPGLRHALSLTGGAAMIGRAGSNVNADLAALETSPTFVGTVTTQANDVESAFETENSSASNATQFRVRHQGGNVVIENLRGSIILPTQTQFSNNVALKWEALSGTAYDIVKLDASNDLQFGVSGASYNNTYWNIPTGKEGYFRVGGVVQASIFSTGLALASGARVNAILDEDDMSSDSATALITQQSANAAFARKVGNSEIVVTGGNGHGSTNTKIRRFTTTQSSVGSDITYADSATLGATFTINTTGFYAITYLDAKAIGPGHVGISVDSSELTTNIQSITAADRLGYTTASGNSEVPALTVIAALSSSSVVRPHTNGLNDATAAAETMFRIKRIG